MALFFLSSIDFFAILSRQHGNGYVESRREFYERSLVENGLVLELERNEDLGVVFVKVHAALDSLKDEVPRGRAQERR